MSNIKKADAATINRCGRAARVMIEEGIAFIPVPFFNREQALAAQEMANKHLDDIFSQVEDPE